MRSDFGELNRQRKMLETWTPKKKEPEPEDLNSPLTAGSGSFFLRLDQPSGAASRTLVLLGFVYVVA